MLFECLEVNVQRTADYPRRRSIQFLAQLSGALNLFVREKDSDSFHRHTLYAYLSLNCKNIENLQYEAEMVECHQRAQTTVSEGDFGSLAVMPAAVAASATLFRQNARRLGHRMPQGAISVQFFSEEDE
jgi:hypothetical protein